MSDVPAVIAIGETMAMVAPARAEPLATAHELRLHPGGAESNLASHLARLGVEAAWVSILGDDALGHRVRDAIAARGVDTRWVAFDATAPTGVYFKDPGRGVLYYRTGSAASRMTPETVAGIPLERARVVHLSGITPVLSNGCTALVDAVFDRVAPSPALLSFDVNYRPSLWSAADAGPVLRDLARRADIVFVGQDEALALWGCADADQMRAILPEPRLLVIKDGDVGATEFSAAGRAFEPAIPTQVVEAVGAGDAFAAGYLAALLRDEDAPGRLRAGHEQAHPVLLSTSDFIAEPAG